MRLAFVILALLAMTSGASDHPFAQLDWGIPLPATSAGPESWSNIYACFTFENSAITSSVTAYPYTPTNRGMAFDSGYSGSALYRPASPATSHVYVGTGLLATNRPWTFATWVNVPTNAAKDIILCGDAPASGEPFYLLALATAANFLGSNNVQVFLWGELLTGGMLNGPDIRGRGWTHVGVTSEGGLYSLYVNGSLIGTKTNSGEFKTGDTLFGRGGAAGAFYSGTNYWMDSTCFFTTRFSSVSMSNIYLGVGP